ncbi:MAG: hypothetical protein ACLTKG_04095 [Collinsella intestinalis]
MRPPLFAIMNPELTYSLRHSRLLPRCGHHDAHHGRYFTLERHTELTDEISEGLLRTVKTMVPGALTNPKSYTARANLLLAGSKSMMGSRPRHQRFRLPRHRAGSAPCSTSLGAV